MFFAHLPSDRSTPATTGIEIELRGGGIAAWGYGVLDAGGARDLCDCLDRLWASGARRVDIDLCTVVYAHPEGEVLVERWAARARADGGAIRLALPPAPSRN